MIVHSKQGYIGNNKPLRDKLANKIQDKINDAINKSVGRNELFNKSLSYLSDKINKISFAVYYKIEREIS